MFDGSFHLPLSCRGDLTGYALWMISPTLRAGVFCEEDVTAMARDLDKICVWIEEWGFKVECKQGQGYSCVKEKEYPFLSKNYFLW